jgi:hypothetical protein
MAGDLSCLDGPRGCAGPVELRTAPDRSDGKHFPRCEAHFEARLDESPRILELLSPSRPDWYDEANVGEHWDEDY